MLRQDEISRTIRFSALLVCLASILSAQGGYAVVSGRVQDISRAVVPRVTVTARNINTDVSVSSVSNSQGYYVFANLIPGTYVIKAQQSGFRDSERNGIVLQVGDHVEIDIVLEIGPSSQSVTVTEQVALLRTDDAQSGMVIDNQRIQQLPEKDRNALAFAT